MSRGGRAGSRARRVVDLSHPIATGMPVYPGDPEVSLRPALTIAHDRGGGSTRPTSGSGDSRRCRPWWRSARAGTVISGVRPPCGIRTSARARSDVFPLPLAGADGAPARVVAWPSDE
mgnify:CR=1 FL=1